MPITSVIYLRAYCPNCKVKTECIEKTWDSSCGGYTDYRYECTECDYTWWCEGADA